MAKKTKQTVFKMSGNQMSGRGNPFVVSGVDVQPDQILIGDMMVQAHELAFWPPSAVPGFIEEVMPDAAATLVIQAQPQSTSLMIKKLGNALSRLQSSHREGLKQGVPDPELERRISDAYGLREAVNRGDTRFFSTSVSLLTYTPESTASEVKMVKQQVIRQARERSCEMVSPRWQQEQSYRGSLPGGKPIISRRLLETFSLSSLYPWTDLDHFEADGIPVGINVHTGNPLIVNRWSAKNPHQVVTADSGSGKSYLIKEMISQEGVMGRPIIVIDPSAKEEYAPLIEGMGGVYIPLGVGQDLRINPLQIWPVSDDKQFQAGPERAEGRPIALRISLVKPIILTLIGGSGDTLIEARVDKCLRNIYQTAGFERDAWEELFRKEVDKDGMVRWVELKVWPTLTMLHTEFVNQGYSDFAETLEPFIGDGTTNMLDGQTNLDVHSPVIGFGIRHLASVQGAFSRAAYAVIMDFAIGYFGAMRMNREKVLVIDEAHNLLRDPVMSVWLEIQFREARKAGIGVTAISQSVMDFLKGDGDHTIWNNTSAKFFLCQPANELKHAAEVAGIDPSLLLPAAHFPAGKILVMLESGQVYTFQSFAPPEMEMLVRADAYTDK